MSHWEYCFDSEYSEEIVRFLNDKQERMSKYVDFYKEFICVVKEYMKTSRVMPSCGMSLKEVHHTTDTLTTVWMDEDYQEYTYEVPNKLYVLFTTGNHEDFNVAVRKWIEEGF